MAIPYLLMGNVGEDGTHLRHAGNHYAKQRIHVKRGVRPAQWTPRRAR
jgi:hypothetical protein